MGMTPRMYSIIRLQCTIMLLICMVMPPLMYYKTPIYDKAPTIYSMVMTPRMYSTVFYKTPISGKTSSMYE